MKQIINLTGITLAGILIFTACNRKNGCMDPTASNYDPEATKDCCCVSAPEPPSSANEVHSGAITSNQTWSNTTIHELAGKVIVSSGVTLTIEAGTIVKGRTGTGSLASALVVEQGAKLEAVGTAAAPIIFTSVLDNIALGQTVGTNLDENDTEKWGGVIILGNAPVSTENGDVTGQIEGIPAEESYGTYGGSNATDNSGTLSYISIRHGGALIGDGNEINGLTLGGVGSGTIINNIEVIANLDDGIECFGGTVNITNALVAYQGDDALDIDQNYSGTIDNFIVINDNGDEGLEIDGPEGSTYVDGMFTLSNGSIWTTNGNGSGCDIKSKAQGTITNTYWNGWSSKSVKIRASFSDTSSCTLKDDAYLYLTAPSGSQSLTITGSQIVGTASVVDQVDVYTKSMDGSGCVDPLEGTAESAVSAGAPITGSATTGHTGDFSWTWASIRGKI